MRWTSFLVALMLALFPCGELRAQRGGHGWTGGGGFSGARFGAGSSSRMPAFAAQPVRTFSSPYRSFAPSGRQLLPHSGFARVPESLGRYNGTYRHRYPDGRDGHRGRHRSAPIFAYNTFWAPNVVGYPYGFGFLPDWLDEWDVNDEPDQAPEAQQQAPANEEAQAAQPETPENPETAEAAPTPMYRPPYQGVTASAEVHPQPATTLIFNNGRPPEQVHNYILTKTALLALDGGARREIPTSSINLRATEEANRASGIDFSLPAD